MMRLEARGSLLMRKAAAKALQLSQLDAGDAAALAWKVHTGGAAAAEELVRLLLQQVGLAFGRVTTWCVCSSSCMLSRAGPRMR
jgi:hypothetical protein